MTSNMHAVILAGGQGKRLWPRSRQGRPKQFADIVGQGRTMLQETVDRLTPLLPLEHVNVITGARYAPLVREQLPSLAERICWLSPRGAIPPQPSGWRLSVWPSETRRR